MSLATQTQSHHFAFQQFQQAPDPNIIHLQQILEEFLCTLLFFCVLTINNAMTPSWPTLKYCLLYYELVASSHTVPLKKNEERGMVNSKHAILEQYSSSSLLNIPISQFKKVTAEGNHKIPIFLATIAEPELKFKQSLFISLPSSQTQTSGHTETCA